MNRYIQILTLTIFIFFHAVQYIYPQTEQYKFRHLTTKQGLPSNTANSIIKDSDGFMWFATDNGLTRYDGYNFKTYRIGSDSVSFQGNQVINKIIEDTDRNLWIATAQYGLQLFNRSNETFTGFINDPEDTTSISNNTVNTIYQDKEGTLWIGTGGGGLNRFDLKNKKFTSFLPDKENPGAPENEIFTIFKDKTGTVWAGTGNGLFLFDRGKKIFTKFDLGKNFPDRKYRRVNDIIEDRNGSLWIATRWGMFKYNRINDQLTHYIPQLYATHHPGSNEHACLLSNIFDESIVESELNGKHILWIATKWGLNKLDIDTDKFEAIHEIKNDPQSLSTSFLKSLYMDDKGLLWIGTATSGADILNTRPDLFHEVSINVPEESFSYQPASFLLDSAQTFWVGGSEGGLFRFDEHFNLTGNYKMWYSKPGSFEKRENNRINCIYENNDKTLWLGFYQWGPVLFDKEQKSFRQIELINRIEATKPIIIENIISDQYGILWVGTNAGLYFRNKNEGELAPAYIVRHDELNKAVIKTLFEDSHNNLWISTGKSGLYLLKPENRSSMQFVHYDSNHDENGFLGNYVHSVYEDRKGTLWFGSDKGLNKFNFPDEEFEPVADFNDGYAGHIFRIYSDDHDNLWIYHASKGLIRYRPYTGKTKKVKVFDVSDGLPFDNFNTYFSPANSFYQSADGRLFIGAGTFTGHSFFWFHPDSIKDNKHIPPVMLTGFKVGNKTFLPDSSIAVKKHITLKHNENFFSFEFAALDFTNPAQNQYAWYLEGMEDDWNYAGNRRLANYTGVPPGNYVFRVKGSNNDGYWNEAGTSIRITILPPVWKTWWAYILYWLAFIVIIYSIIHYYLRRQRLLQTLAIEQIEAQKLKELDSMKSRFFANISHEFRTPLTLILGPLQKLIGKTTDDNDKQELSLMQRNARRLRELINQLLNLSKLEAGKMSLQAKKQNIVSLVRNYIQSFESLARQKKISLTFIADEEEIDVYIDLNKIEQVLNNLLSNAFKFTNDGGKITVTVTPLNPPSRGDTPLTPPLKKGVGGIQGVSITISDTGTGIPPEKLEHIFDRFYQADDSKSRHYEGTGIGLALAKELVELHHGQITVESKERKGTTFTILLLLGKDHLKPDEIIEGTDLETNLVVGQENETYTDLPEHEQTLSEEENGQPVMLIVEDNTDMRKYIAGYFKNDYRIIEAGNGKAGVEKAVEHIPDIIISDVMMPVMDGYGLCEKVKTDERTSHIPVILLTARAAKESRLEGLGTGADDFITKPFDGDELQVRVKNLIEQRRKLSEYYRKEFEIIREDLKESALTMDEKFLNKVKTVVEKNLSNPEYGVEEFASDMALSRFQLHRKLSALLNQSTTEFIRTIRLNFAIGLLKKRTGTISEIAYDAGFNNPTYFSISFKKQFGVSPSEYLNRLDHEDNS